jgi:hypothetical protein
VIENNSTTLIGLGINTPWTFIDWNKIKSSPLNPKLQLVIERSSTTLVGLGA